MNELVGGFGAAFASRLPDRRRVAFFMLINYDESVGDRAEAAIEAVVVPRQARRRDGWRKSIVKRPPGRRCLQSDRAAPDGIVPWEQNANQASITVNHCLLTEIGNEVYAGTQVTGLVEFKLLKSVPIRPRRSERSRRERSAAVGGMIDKYVGYYTPTF